MRDLKKVWSFELKRLLSNKGFLFLAVAWPLLYAIFFGRIYSDHVVNNMPLAIVDMDKTQISRTITRFAGSMRSFNIQETFENPEQLKDKFLSGDFAAALIIPKGLQRSIKHGHRPHVTVWINATNVVVANLTASEISYLMGTVSGGIQLKFLQKAGSSTKRAMESIQPLPLEMARLHNPGLNYLSYLTPGIWAAIIHQVVILLGALCFVPHVQRKEIAALNGTVERPKSWFFGKWSFYFILGVITFEIFFRGLFPLFNIKIESSVWALLLFSSLFIASALSLGTLISLATTRTLGALKGVLLLASPAFILSGYTFPISQMPEIYKFMTAIFPLTPFINGYRKLYQEGVGFLDVVPDITHLAVLFFIYAVLSYFFFKKRWEKSL